MPSCDTSCDHTNERSHYPGGEEEGSHMVQEGPSP